MLKVLTKEKKGALFFLRDFFSKNFVTRILPIIIVIAGLIPIIVYFANSSSFDTSYHDNEQKIAELEKQLEDLSDVATNDEVISQTMESGLNSASSLGTKVASLQNDYRKFIKDTSDEERDKGLKETADALRECFTEGLDAQAIWFATDKEYTWQFKTTYSVAASNIDCLFLCYAKTDDPLTLLMCVKAKYDANKNKFVSFEKQVTSVGNEYLSVPTVE